MNKGKKNMDRGKKNINRGNQNIKPKDKVKYRKVEKKEEPSGTNININPKDPISPNITKEEQKEDIKIAPITDTDLKQVKTDDDLKPTIQPISQVKSEPLNSAPKNSKQEESKIIPEVATLTMKRVKPNVKVYEKVEGIVNAANGGLMHGAGVAGAISSAGGPEIQRLSYKYIRELGRRLEDGEACTTGKGKLKAPIQFVIHAVGPIWQGGYDGEVDKLKNAVKNSLAEADWNKLKSISIPAISSGIFGYPKELCAQHMLETVIKYIDDVPNTTLKEIHLCNFDYPTTNIFVKAFDKMEKILKKEAIVPAMLTKTNVVAEDTKDEPTVENLEEEKPLIVEETKEESIEGKVVEGQSLVDEKNNEELVVTKAEEEKPILEISEEGIKEIKNDKEEKKGNENAKEEMKEEINVQEVDMKSKKKIEEEKTDVSNKVDATQEESKGIEENVEKVQEELEPREKNENLDEKEKTE